MSIGTDVARIKGNITAALTAIADKGVTVPDGSTSDALAGLIASIEAGGGGSGIVYTSGTLTFASSTTCKGNVITHGLGVVPQIFILGIKYYTGNTKYGLQYYGVISEGIRNLGYGATKFYQYFLNSGVNSYYRIDASPNISITIDESTITMPELSNAVYVSGIPYSWHAIGGIEA